MKGVVFTKFLEMVEEEYGMAVAESVLDTNAGESGGIYSSIGTYDPAELVGMVGALARLTGTRHEHLLRTFGGFMLRFFESAYPAYFEREADLFGFLKSVEHRIHVDVRKLYPDAELPSFACRTPEPGVLEMTYRSKRRLPDFAEGLIAACAERYRQPVSIAREDGEDGHGGYTRFTITKRA
ncbi:MAG: heme NO-binding domain-containing protein [Alphaproteobacteria bacterium]|nr:heme NO-binding domain-containing protein [Alphaproteobacteria bacterium]